METKVHTTPTKSIILLNRNFTARVGTDFSELIPDEVVKYLKSGFSSFFSIFDSCMTLFCRSATIMSCSLSLKGQIFLSKFFLIENLKKF